MSILTVHVNLGEHGELGAVTGGKLLDFSFGTWLLVHELVAWEGDDFETSIFVLLMDLDHFFVVLVG